MSEPFSVCLPLVPLQPLFLARPCSWVKHTGSHMNVPVYQKHRGAPWLPQVYLGSCWFHVTLTLSQIFHLTHGLGLLVHPWTHSLGVATESWVIRGGSGSSKGPAFDLPSARIAEFTAEFTLTAAVQVGARSVLLRPFSLASHLSLPVLIVSWTYFALWAPGVRSHVSHLTSFPLHLALSP